MMPLLSTMTTSLHCQYPVIGYRTLVASFHKQVNATQISLLNPAHKRIEVPKRPYQPPLSSSHIEPVCIPNSSISLDIFFQQHYNTVWKEQHDLPPRDDLWDPVLHQAGQEFPCYSLPPRIQRKYCKHHQGIWDVFDEDGLQNSIRGYQFNIVTGNVKPICCKPHSTAQMKKSLSNR